MLKNPLMEQLRAQISSDDKALMDESFALADRIYFLLKKHNLTQRQLADKLGKKESEVSKWLSGGHNFTSHTLTKIGLAIGERIYTIPGNAEFAVVNNDVFNKILTTSFVRIFYKNTGNMGGALKYENFVSPEISELEVNSIGVLCHNRDKLYDNFTQAHIKPEAFKNIERVKVS